MTSKRAITAGRIARGTIAIAEIAPAGLGALLLLTWRCCGSPKEPFANPLVWGALAAMPVAIAALPFVSKRLRGTAIRWVLLPLVLADLALCAWLAWESMPRLLDGGSNAM